MKQSHDDMLAPCWLSIIPARDTRCHSYLHTFVFTIKSRLHNLHGLYDRKVWTRGLVAKLIELVVVVAQACSRESPMKREWGQRSKIMRIHLISGHTTAQCAQFQAFMWLHVITQVTKIIGQHPPLSIIIIIIISRATSAATSSRWLLLCLHSIDLFFTTEARSQKT